MDLRQLRYFIAIVEAGSFSKAATRLNIAQPALSLHVRNMETELGTELLLRTPHGVRPTEAGVTLAESARGILAQFEATRRAILDSNEEPSGEVLLGFPTTISQHLSVPLIVETRRRYPKIQLRVTEAMSGFILEWMLDKRIDIGLLYIPVNERNLRSNRMLVEELCLFGAAGGENGALPADGSAVSLDDVARLPIILPSSGHGLRALIEEHLAEESVPLDTIIEVDSYASIKELVSYGLGYSILPVAAVADEVAAGRFRTWPIGTPPMSRSVYMVRHSDRASSKAAAAVEALCRSVLRDLVSSGRWHAQLLPETEPGT